MSMRATPDRNRQGGAALFIALIALLAMTFAGLALIRSMDTAGLIAGNFSFRQAALSVSDLGLEGALGALESVYIANGRDSNQKCNANQTSGCNTTCTSDCTYYAWYWDSAGCTVDSNCDNGNGVNQRINWNNIPANTLTFAALGTGYSYQYVIERLCDGTYYTAHSSAPDITPALVNQYCFSMNLSSGGSSQESRSAQIGTVAAANEVAYRLTLRVTGPHNASTMIQTIMMKN